MAVDLPSVEPIFHRFTTVHAHYRSSLKSCVVAVTAATELVALTFGPLAQSVLFVGMRALAARRVCAFECAHCSRTVL